MTMSLTILDLALIGSTTGLTTLASMYITMRLMQRFTRKRKAMIIEQMMSDMHDQAQNDEQFEEIVKQMKEKRGGFYDRGE